MPSSRVFVLGNPDYVSGDVAPVTALPISVAFFVQFANNNPASTEVPFYYGDLSSGTVWLTLEGQTNGTFRAWARDSTAEHFTDTDFCDEDWHHVMMAYYVNGSSNRQVDMYVNGVLDGTPSPNSNATKIADFDRLGFGMRRDSSPSQPFSGKIALAGIWSAQLTEANAISLTAGALPPTIQGANLEAYYFDGTESDNDHENAYNLTASGSPSWDSGDWPIVAPSGVVILRRRRM